MTSSNDQVGVRTLAAGNREGKFEELARIALEGPGWAEAPGDPRAPFTAAGDPDWARRPALDEVFLYDGSGVMPGRAWVIAPDPDTLTHRSAVLLHELDIARKRELFGEGAGLAVDRALKDALPGHRMRGKATAKGGSLEASARYPYRTLDRQWVIPDKRVLNRPTPTLWKTTSEHQVYLTAPNVDSASGGMAISASALPPDTDHYAGRGGRVYPVRSDAGSGSNVRPGVLSALASAYGREVTADEVAAYIIGVAAPPGYTSTFRQHLTDPVVCIPFSADPALFEKAAGLGRRSIWYQTYGARMKIPAAGTTSGERRACPKTPPRPAPSQFPPVLLHSPPRLATILKHGSYTAALA